MDFSDQTILVTGAAGFIGFYLAKRILEENPSAQVVGYDNVNDYYDVSLKEERLRILKEVSGRQETGSFIFVKGDLADKECVDSVFRKYQPAIVVNLAAPDGSAVAAACHFPVIDNYCLLTYFQQIPAHLSQRQSYKPYVHP